MGVVESWRKHQVSQKSFHALLSSASGKLHLYVDDRKKLESAFNDRHGKISSALEHRGVDLSTIHNSHKSTLEFEASFLKNAREAVQHKSLEHQAQRQPVRPLSR
jgi:hypothetical protein